MRGVLLGNDRDTGEEVYMPKSALDTHLHLIGGTGKGKTTAVHTLLHGLWRDPMAKDCWFVIDRMGGLSFDLLLWLTSRYCPPHVRRRVVYIEPANENIVLGFNPLTYETAQHGYYKVGRATDCILRAWDSQDIGQMPRLARWVFNAFWAAAQLGLTVADCWHMFNPGSPYHRAMFDALPPQLRAEWADILNSGGRAVEILDSSRNRLKPYFEAPILRHMFGTVHHGLDVGRFMAEGRIVIVNLANQNRIGPQLADAIGGLVINDVLATARGLMPWQRRPTYLLLDEFQRFVGPDLEEALPEVRQLQLRLILAHQSFSQLIRGDQDLTTLIFQAQSRLIFGVQGEDADLLANELAALEYDPRKIKDEIRVRRQKQIGHRVVTLASWSDSQSQAKSWNETWGQSWSGNEAKRLRKDYSEETTTSSGQGDNKGGGRAGGTTEGTTRGGHEQLVAEFEEFDELVSRTFATFDEDRQVWARKLRERRTGEAFLRLVDDSKIRDLAVKKSTPGHLRFSATELHDRMPRILEEIERFKEENYRSGLFLTPEEVERETDERLRQLLQPPIVVDSQKPTALASRQPVDDGFCD